MSRGRIIWLAFSAIVAATVGYFVTTLQSSSGTANYAMTASALPKLTARNFIVFGGFPALTKAPFDVAAVNRSLRSVLTDTEAAYSSQVRGMLQVPRGERPTNIPGTYAVTIDPKLTSASASLVSGLLPVESVAYGGANDQSWISYSISVPSGRDVDLLDAIFRHPPQALAYIALETAKQFCTTGVNDPCYDQTPLEAEAGMGLSPTPMGHDPTASNDQYQLLPPSGPSVYRYMALTPSGLAIGFPFGSAVAGTSRTGIVIPYGLLQPYLNSYGKQVVSSAAEPRFVNLPKNIRTTEWMALWGTH